MENRSKHSCLADISLPHSRLSAENSVGKHELSFYLALECYPVVKDSWEQLLETSYGALSKIFKEGDPVDEIVPMVYLEKLFMSVDCNYLTNIFKHEKKGLQHLLCREIIRRRNRNAINSLCDPCGDSLLDMLNEDILTELNLEGVKRFYQKEDFTLHKVIFRLPQLKNLEIVNISQNSITSLPVDIGQLTNLKQLNLSDNYLNLHGIPYTLTFCSKLETLLLNDNRTLEALPGFLLKMSSLIKVLRDGITVCGRGSWNFLSGAQSGPQSFKELSQGLYKIDDRKTLQEKSTEQAGKTSKKKVPSLATMVEKTIASSACDYFTADIPEYLKEDLTRKLTHYNSVCWICEAMRVQPDCELGFYIYFLKVEYLGNKNVPFQLWVCSQNCLQAFKDYILTEQPPEDEEEFLPENPDEETISQHSDRNTSSNSVLSRLFRRSPHKRSGKIGCNIM